MYGRIDISSVKLCATQWTFALPRHTPWKILRAVPPKLEEPAGRYFIHCIQHWILRNPHTNPFKTMQSCDVYQETILVDSHGQIYRIKSYPDMPDDWGVYYFSLKPDVSYIPLSFSQIEAVKNVRLVEAEGWEGIPSKAPFDYRQITTAIKTTVEVAVLVKPEQEEQEDQEDHDALSRLAEPDLHIWQRPLNVKPVEDVVEKKTISVSEKQKLCDAYILAQYGSEEKKVEGMALLRYTLKREMHKNAWPRINHMTRTMLAHRIAKRFHITFPSANEKQCTAHHGYTLYAI